MLTIQTHLIFVWKNFPAQEFRVDSPVLPRNKTIRENISVFEGSLGLICLAINSNYYKLLQMHQNRHFKCNILVFLQNVAMCSWSL